MSGLPWLRDTFGHLPRLSRVASPRGGAQVDPSASLFIAIRRRLILWYTAVLALILLLAGLILYIGMQAVLLGPVTQALSVQAQQMARFWQQDAQPPPACSGGFFGRQQVPFFVACFDERGNLLGNNRLAGLSPDFTSTSLAQSALTDTSSSPTDFVEDDQAGFGAIRRLALVVRTPAGNQVLGVVQVGVSVAGDIRALNTLITLLLLVGAVTLLGSAVGGILLADRALAPARLSYERQQRFIADASHELRTPLTLLRADAEVLLRGRDRLASDDAALLDDIVTEAAHMSALADNLLTLARFDNSAHHLEADVVDLGEVAAETGRRVAALAEERGVSIRLDPVPDALVIGDRAWLGEAALILVDNAIKYNRLGGTVTISVHRADQHVALEVRDTGVGIAPEHLPHLGERFYRVDKARSRELGGAGLGLAIARHIAAAHHGTLTLQSVADQGTTATLSLPAVGAPHRS